MPIFSLTPAKGAWMLMAVCLLIVQMPAAGQTLGLSARYDHSLTSDGNGSSTGLVSTNQVALHSRIPVAEGNVYVQVNTRVGRGYTEIGSRGAEAGYDHGSWFVGLGQSTGTEFSWITATAVTGNLGNLSMLSAFPKRTLTLGARLTAMDTVRLLTHGSDGTRASPGSGTEWSWVRKRGQHTIRVADYRQASFATATTRPRQTGASFDTTVGSWGLNLRAIELRSAVDEGLVQVGIGARRSVAPSVSLVADAMMSRSDFAERDHFLSAAGVFWLFHSQADVYILAYRVRNDANSLRLVGPAVAQRVGDDPSGLAIGLRVRSSFDW
jgi:hypothetical protein